jgi:uncharacterized Ntn-hydrolase superfamily protein
MEQNNVLSLNEMGINMNEMDEMSRDALRVEMTPNAIPDLDNLLENIQNLLEDIETPEMQQLEKTNRKEFEKILTHKYYSDISSIKIINLMLEPARYENLEKLLDMFERLKQVKNGNLNIQDAHKNWCEKMNEEYVYSKHGGKENFEKVMKETQNKNK